MDWCIVRNDITRIQFAHYRIALQESDSNEGGNGKKQERPLEKKLTNQNKLFDKRRVNFEIGNGIGIRASPQSEYRNERTKIKEIRAVDDKVDQLQKREKALLEAVRRMFC